MDATREYFEHTNPNVHLVTARAYEVSTLHGTQRSCLGWVVEQIRDDGTWWVAWAVVSHTGDSFLGTRATAAEAIQLIWDNEKEGRDAQG